MYNIITATILLYNTHFLSIQPAFTIDSEPFIITRTSMYTIP